MQDRLEKERVDAKNTVEEYVYEMRNKLSNELEDYMQEDVSVECYYCLVQWKGRTRVRFMVDGLTLADYYCEK